MKKNRPFVNLFLTARSLGGADDRNGHVLSHPVACSLHINFNNLAK